jgi:hypothetical protein
MSDPTVPIGVGDVLCTRSSGWVGRLIRFGAALLGKPNTVNHVAIFMGPGSDGKDRVIEGRPGGVGYADAQTYLDDPWTVDNREQPKSEEQRAQIHDAALALLGTPYDWVGIGQAAMAAIRAPDLYRSKAWQDGKSPDHVVCSSMADWVYAEIGLANPGRTGPDKVCTPGMWAEFIVTRAWTKAT